MQYHVDTKIENEYDGAVITNIRRGSTARGRGHIVYANLVDRHGDVLISATLDYILDAVKTKLPTRP